MRTIKASFTVLAALIILITIATAALALPPEVELDRLLLQAKSALDARNYTQASDSLARAQKLGVALPQTFYFHYGRALAGSGNLESGKRMIEEYLNQSGTKGKFYQEALVELNTIEAALVRRDAEQAKVQAAQDKVLLDYADALDKYDAQMAGCDKEYLQEYKERKEKAERLGNECRDYGRYGCSSARDREGEALFKRMNFAVGWQYELPGREAWCRKRYSPPRKPDGI